MPVKESPSGHLLLILLHVVHLFSLLLCAVCSFHFPHAHTHALLTLHCLAGVLSKEPNTEEFAYWKGNITDMGAVQQRSSYLRYRPNTPQSYPRAADRLSEETPSEHPGPPEVWQSRWGTEAATARDGLTFLSFWSHGKPTLLLLSSASGTEVCAATTDPLIPLAAAHRDDHFCRAIHTPLQPSCSLLCSRMSWLCPLIFEAVQFSLLTPPNGMVSALGLYLQTSQQTALMVIFQAFPPFKPFTPGKFFTLAHQVWKTNSLSHSSASRRFP